MGGGYCCNCNEELRVFMAKQIPNIIVLSSLANLTKMCQLLDQCFNVLDRICRAFGLTLTGPHFSAVEPPFPHILLLIRGWKIRFNPPYLMCLYNEIIASVVQ